MYDSLLLNNIELKYSILTINILILNTFVMKLKLEVAILNTNLVLSGLLLHLG